MLKKYNKFLLDSLLLESQLIYQENFIDIVKEIKMDNWGRPEGEVANFLLNALDIELDLVHNYIDTSETPGLVSFVPEDKIKFDKVTITSTHLLNLDSNKAIIDSYNIPPNGLISSLSTIPNDFKLVKTIKCDDYKNARINLNGYYLYYLQSNFNPEKFALVYRSPNGVSPIANSIPMTIKKSDIKLGRFLNKLVDIYSKEKNINISPSDIERFVNAYNACLLVRKDILNNFEIVKGEDIRKWYNESRYESDKGNYGGQLGNSCMRYAHCQKFLNIYVDNPDVCQLLILKDKTGNKISGRALLWTTIDGQKFMDRIYTNKDSLINLFLKWGRENGYICKNETTNFNEDIIVRVKPILYSRYPYMDTLSVYMPNKGLLTNKQDYIKFDKYPDIRKRTGMEMVKGLFNKNKQKRNLVFTLTSTEGYHGTYRFD